MAWIGPLGLATGGSGRCCCWPCCCFCCATRASAIMMINGGARAASWEPRSSDLLSRPSRRIDSINGGRQSCSTWPRAARWLGLTMWERRLAPLPARQPPLGAQGRSTARIHRADRLAARAARLPPRPLPRPPPPPPLPASAERRPGQARALGATRGPFEYSPPLGGQIGAASCASWAGKCERGVAFAREQHERVESAGSIRPLAR